MSNHDPRPAAPAPVVSPSNRRGVLAGAAAVGAAVIAAKALPGTPATIGQPATVVARSAPDTRGGYQLTAHVRRYYETTHA
jgi:hypothetical protein